ncbi:MAG: hypothetical protein HKP61_12940, partial [Dactylosporangium sp.]|nr:hypothetical protein [Dactylosporangium sp.]NNJ61822.1 hypothetical protein [Dactylosporangium sp.]
AVLVLVVALLGLPAQLEIRASDGHGYATRDAVAAIAEQRQPGDVIVYALWESTGSWTARDAMARYVPPDRRPRDIFAVRPQRTDGQRSARECADLEACFDDPPRVWVLRHGSFGDPLLGLGEAKERLLRERYTMAFVHQYRGMTVALLVPPG